jgi:hypothetical protein
MARAFPGRPSGPAVPSSQRAAAALPHPGLESQRAAAALPDPGLKSRRATAALPDSGLGSRRAVAAPRDLRPRSQWAAVALRDPDRRSRRAAAAPRDSSRRFRWAAAALPDFQTKNPGAIRAPRAGGTWKERGERASRRAHLRERNHHADIRTDVEDLHAGDPTLGRRRTTSRRPSLRGRSRTSSFTAQLTAPAGLSSEALRAIVALDL